jgi:hypothetical protein
MLNRREKGPGLSPSPRRIHMTIPYDRVPGFGAGGCFKVMARPMSVATRPGGLSTNKGPGVLCARGACCAVWPVAYYTHYATMTRSRARDGGGQRYGAWPHGRPYDQKKGARPGRGLRPFNILKVGFFKTEFVFFLINMPIFSRFLPFLGDIGHFWRPDSWRKLGM